MSRVKVSELLELTSPDGSEELLINDGGASKKITISNLPDTNTTYSVGDGGLTTNNFTNADHSKLNAIEAEANVTDTANVVAALTAGTNIAISGGGTISSTDTNTTYSVGDGGLTQINFTSSDNTKLDGIEVSATADQTNAEIKTAVEAATSIALGGSPTATTQSGSDNSTKIATTAYTDAQVATIVDSACLLYTSPSPRD